MVSDTNDMVMPVAPMYGGGNGSFGNSFGGDGWWILLLFILLVGGGAWGNGVGGGTPYIANDVQRGFDQASLTNGIYNLQTGMNNGFSNLQQSLCSGFAGVNGAVSNGFAQAEIANNSRQMADMQQNFALQSALQNCCCENRASIADLKYTVATENCADRQEISNALRDVLDSNQRNTQIILDKLCAQEIDALKNQNLELQNQLNIATFNASQVAQNAYLTRVINDARPTTGGVSNG